MLRGALPVDLDLFKRSRGAASHSAPEAFVIHGCAGLNYGAIQRIIVLSGWQAANTSPLLVAHI
ncbi:MAG: hypothetical protein ACJAZN_003873 [Planctomycetota bacterium]